MSMRCTGEKCPLKNVLDELSGDVKSCTAHDCVFRTLPEADDDDKQHSGLIAED